MAHQDRYNHRRGGERKVVKGRGCQLCEHARPSKHSRVYGKRGIAERDLLCYPNEQLLLKGLLSHA